MRAGIVAVLAVVVTLYCVAQVGCASFGVYALNFQVPNALVVFSGDTSNGRLTLAGTVATGGNGRAGGEQSQSALAVYGNYLFGVNPGSNSISMFEISPNDPRSVTLVGSPVDSQGDQPDTVTASKSILENLFVVLNI